MASTATSRAGAASTAGVTEEDAKVEWRRRRNKGVPVDDGDEEEEEGEIEGAERRVTYAVAGYEEAEMQMGPGDGKADMVARGDRKAETEGAAVGGKRRSNPRFADPAALDEEISGGNNSLQPAELPRRRRKVVAKRTRLNVDGTEVQNNNSQAQSPPPVVRGPERVYQENANLKLRLALKPTELKEGEIRMLQLELTLKLKETESLQKQVEDLKAENEQLRKNAKPPKVERKCRSCNAYAMHDYRNCPLRRRAASSLEESDREDSSPEAKPPKIERKCRSCNAYVMHDYRNCPLRRRAASSPESDGEDSSPEEEDGEDP